MSKDQAFKRARERARKRQEEVFVIWSVEETDVPGQHYHTATDYELETFYLGTSDANVVACVEPS